MAACLCFYVRDAAGREIVRRAEAAAWTPLEILERFNGRVIWAHGAHRALGGSMHPTNLWPTWRADDKPQTARDIGAIAKVKRIVRSENTHRAVMAAKVGLPPIDVRGDLADGPAAKRAWPSRPFPKRQHTWPKRPFQSRRPKP